MGLVVEGLRLVRGGRLLIDGLDLSLSRGSIWVVLGPNGSGKSSLLLTLAGELLATDGMVRLEGVPIQKWTPWRRAAQIGWQGALPSAEFGFTVGERLASVPEGSREVRDALEVLDLERFSSRRLGELSAGERQRVELAALWLREAPVWLLDEPTAHLDLRHQIRLLDLLREEARAGRTIVVVLHDLSQAHALADRAVALFGDGRVRSGPTDDVLEPAFLENLYGARVQYVRGESGNGLLPVYRNQETTGTGGK